MKLHCTLMNTKFREEGGEGQVERGRGRQTFDARPVLEGWGDLKLGEVCVLLYFSPCSSCTLLSLNVLHFSILHLYTATALLFSPYFCFTRFCFIHFISFLHLFCWFVHLICVTHFLFSDLFVLYV